MEQIIIPKRQVSNPERSLNCQRQPVIGSKGRAAQTKFIYKYLTENIK